MRTEPKPSRPALRSALISSVLLAALLCACRGPGPRDIRIGAFAALSGPGAEDGLAARRGIEMAVDSLNAAGGLAGRKLRLIVADDQGTPTGAAVAVERLIAADSVAAVIGGFDSAGSLAAARACQRRGIPMLSPGSTHPALTRTGEYVFRACLLDPVQGEVMARFARSALKLETAAILRDTTSAHAAALADRFKEYFFQADGDVLADRGYAAGDRDFTAPLRAIRARRPAALFLPAGAEAGAVAAQARKLGITAVLLGGDGWAAAAASGEALRGGFHAGHYSADNPRPALRKFVGDYAKRFGGALPGAPAALGYDAALLLGDALRRAGSPRPDSLRAALAATRFFPGVTGDITLGLDRDAVKQAVVFEVAAAENGAARSVYRDFLAP